MAETTRKIEAGLDGETVIITTTTTMTMAEYLQEAHQVYHHNISMKGGPAGARPFMISPGDGKS